MRCAIVIPARMASTRFPGKPLCDLAGKPMVQWVFEAAVASGCADEVLIATPDDEIIQAVNAFGAKAVKTRIDHLSGTDRLAEVAETLHADVYVNVQGDEPLIKPESIASCAAPLIADASVAMGSVFANCPADELENHAVVKVVVDLKGDALYFSRYAIPFPRHDRAGVVKKHIGIYAYRRKVLLEFAGWGPTPLEQTESLEQLRFLEHGVPIRMTRGEDSALAVDTPEQAEEVRRRMADGWPGKQG